MVPSTFRSYHLAVALYRRCQALSVPAHLRDQLARASSSVVLNLGEGCAKPSPADRRRYYGIALGSLREVQSLLDLLAHVPAEVTELADHAGASVYRLCHPKL